MDRRAFSKSSDHMAMFDIHTVQDSKSLLATLRGMDITVPPRGTEGRNRREHVEPNVICRLFATLAKANLLTYPLSLTQREKPDFLSMQGNGCVGVEVSEVIPKGYAHYAAVANECAPEQPSGLLEPGHFRYDLVRTPKEVRRLLAQTRLTARPFYGNEPEQEWARFMANTINVKLQKLADYEKFDENWLALYANLPLPSVNRHKAVDMLRASLADVWVARPTFDAVFIERGAFIIKITPDKSEWFVINDIWN